MNNKLGEYSLERSQKRFEKNVGNTHTIKNNNVNNYYKKELL